MSERKFVPKFQIPKGADTNIIGEPIEGMLFWRNLKNEFLVAACHYTADPEKRSEEWFKAATKGMRADQIQREYEIDFESRAGQKAFWYLSENPDRWFVPNLGPRDIPKHWRIRGSLDYGSLNPSAGYIYAITDQRHVIALYEFYKPAERGMPITPEIAQFFRGEHPEFPVPKELCKRIETIIADPAIFRKTQEIGGEEMRSIADLLEEQGLYTLEPGENERQAGLERYHDMLRYNPDEPNEEPWFTICKRCPNLWRELNTLVYDELPPHLLMNKNKKEDVVAKDDHGYDSSRYLLMSVSMPSGKPEKKKAPAGSLEAFEKDMFRGQNRERIL